MVDNDVTHVWLKARSNIKCVMLLLILPGPGGNLCKLDHFKVLTSRHIHLMVGVSCSH
jgi:hypothetical protein